MTERTTDREALADEAQAGYDALEAQREATAARSIAQRALQAQGDIASMYDEEIRDLRADVTRLEGERDALRTALTRIRDKSYASKVADEEVYTLARAALGEVSQ